MKHIKNVVFDFGGVLVDLDKQRCTDAFRRIGAEAVSKYVDECRTEDFFHDLEIGRISVAEFCAAVRKHSPECIASDESICNTWNMLLTGIPKRRLQKLLMLKDRFRLFVLSNTNPIHWQKAVADFFPFNGHTIDDYFEQVYLSYEMRMAKPDSTIFRKVLIDAGLTAEETLFIDDSPVNCAAASEVGINARLVASGDQWLDYDIFQ